MEVHPLIQNGIKDESLLVFWRGEDRHSLLKELGEIISV
jgi:hypothetical protein